MIAVLYLRLLMQVETLAEAGSYEDALSLCAMCKVRGGAVVVVVAVVKGFPTAQCHVRQAVLDAGRLPCSGSMHLDQCNVACTCGRRYCSSNGDLTLICVLNRRP